MPRLNAANNGQSLLSGGITNTDTALLVDDASLFPSVPFLISIGTEIMEVKSVTGNSFTVERAQEGTVAQAHNGGSDVVHRLTAGMYNSLDNDYATIDHEHTYADIQDAPTNEQIRTDSATPFNVEVRTDDPASPTAGRIWFRSDL